MSCCKFCRRSGLLQWKILNSAITKLKNYSNLKQAIEIDKHAASLEVIKQNNAYPIYSYLKKLEICIANRKSVIISYRKSGDDTSNDRQVDPYRIIYWKTNGIWLHIAVLEMMFEHLEWIE